MPLDGMKVPSSNNMKSYGSSLGESIKDRLIQNWFLDIQEEPLDKQQGMQIWTFIDKSSYNDISSFKRRSIKWRH